MNTPNLPGFTADASVYKTSQHYQSTGTLLASQTTLATRASVIPQMALGWHWPTLCELGCTAAAAACIAASAGAAGALCFIVEAACLGKCGASGFGGSGGGGVYIG